MIIITTLWIWAEKNIEKTYIEKTIVESFTYFINLKIMTFNVKFKVGFAESSTNKRTTL